MALKSKGTTVYVVIEDSTGCEVVKIGCPTGVSGLGGSKPQINTECLDSDEATFIPGTAQPGAMNMSIDYDPAVTSHQDLIDLFDNDNVVTFIIGLSDGAKTIEPTVDSSCTINFPTNRTFIEFDGYVADFPIDIPLGGKVTSAVSVQRSGPRTFHRKST